MSLLCVPITVHDLDQALEAAAQSRALGADLVEFRIDECFSGSGDHAEERMILRLVADSPLPCIITCRSASEGGSYDGDDMERVSLYERLGTAQGKNEHPPRFIDCELATYTRSANLRQKINLAVDHPAQLREMATSLILSMHDFQTRPADLTRRLLAAQNEPAARIVKVAYRARSLRDSLELLDIPGESSKPTIALGMGEFGLLSRILAPKFEAFLTFASLSRQSATAPGQPTVEDLLNLYRFRSINAHTRVFGIVGWPLGHSLSPLLHNAGFAATDTNAVYVPLPIASHDDPETSFVSFKATLLDLIHHPRLDFRGCSVTLPHKENLVRLAREQGWGLDEPAAAVGAGNTLVLDEARGIRVLNTDIPAALAALQTELPDLAGLSVVVLGAGGVARGVAYGLMAAGAHVVVCNRTVATAERVAAELGKLGLPGSIRGSGIDDVSTIAAQAYVNCTPLGMKGGPDPQRSALPEQLAALPGAVVFDTVYNPLETPTIQGARSMGLRTIDGATMFVHQAEAQFKLFTGSQAPSGLFATKVAAALGGAE